MRIWKKWLIEKLGGFSDIQTAIDAISEKNPNERRKILTLAVKKLFNTISHEDILRAQEGTGLWLWKGNLLSREDAEHLQVEATKLIDSKLWNILQTDIKYQINKRLYIEGKTEMDMIVNKLWYYLFDAFNTRLKSLKAGSPSYNIKK